MERKWMITFEAFRAIYSRLNERGGMRKRNKQRKGKKLREF